LLLATNAWCGLPQLALAVHGDTLPVLLGKTCLLPTTTSSKVMFVAKFEMGINSITASKEQVFFWNIWVMGLLSLFSVTHFNS
jgi:hypothetical protein